MPPTPGPWKAGKGVDDDETRCFVTQGIPGRPEFLIAEIQNGAPGDCLDTEMANATLIAAAPDLIDALKELIAAGQFAVESTDELAIMLRLGRATDAANTAVAKAEGRS